MTFSEKLSYFVTHHWLMVVAFLLLVFLIFVEEARGSGALSGLSVEDAVDLINKDELLILDLRSEKDFARAHIARARHLPLQSFAEKIEKYKGLKKKSVLVVSERGYSDQKAIKHLKKMGFEKVESLRGGMHAWMSASMPTKQEKDHGKS